MSTADVVRSELFFKFLFEQYKAKINNTLPVFQKYYCYQYIDSIITDSNIFDRVGRIDICLWFVFEDFWPDHLKTAVMWVSFQMSGKGTISNILLNNLEMEYDIGFAIKWIPQWNTTIWFVPVIYVIKCHLKCLDLKKSFSSILDIFNAN